MRRVGQVGRAGGHVGRPEPSAGGLGVGLGPDQEAVLEDLVQRLVGRRRRPLPGGDLPGPTVGQRVGVEPVGLEIRQVGRRRPGVGPAEHDDGPVVVERDPVLADHQPGVGLGRAVHAGGLEHHGADLVPVQERLPVVDLVVADRLAEVVPLEERLPGEEVHPAVEERLPLAGGPPGDGVALGQRRVEDVALDRGVLERLGGLEREVVGVEAEAELRLADLAAPAGHARGDRGEDQRRWSPAGRRSTRTPSRRRASPRSRTCRDTTPGRSARSWRRTRRRTTRCSSGPSAQRKPDAAKTRNRLVENLRRFRAKESSPRPTRNAK